jgi:hypothetical protein
MARTTPRGIPLAIAKLEEQASRAPLPRQPEPARGDRPLTERDPHLAAIEQLLAAPASERLDAADRYRRERPLVTATTAPAAPEPAPEPVRAQPVRSARPSPGDAIPTVRSRRPSPGDNVPTVEPPGAHGVRAPRYTQEDEQRRRDQVAREAAEPARQQAERQRGPRQGA